jgi:FAD/FMN-containing dehydrogenase
VALKLVPALGQLATAWAVLSSADAALAVLHRLRAGCGEHVESFELLSPEAIATVAEQLPDIRLPLATRNHFQLLIEAEIPQDRLQELLLAAMEAGEVEDAVFATSQQQAEALWAVRENVPMAERLEGPAIKNDIAVPVEQVTRFHQAAMQLFGRILPDARPIVFGHLGDGNLHWNIRPPAGAEAGPWLQTHETMARRALHDLVAQFAGSISAEHGIGTLKAAEFARLGDPGKIFAMRAIKRALDPADILNPGKLFV